jgi:acetoacetate decarboxylase
MPDSSGFGTYTETGIVIPCLFGEEEVSFVSQMYLDIEPPISAGREIWGFPKKYAHPKLEVVKDTLTGTLEYAGQQVAMGTMGYKHESLAGNGVRTTAMLTKTQVNLKIIPGVDGEPEICQLVALNLTDITVKGSWIGPGRLHLIPHVNAPVADLPVRKVLGAHHFIADLTLPFGQEDPRLHERLIPRVALAAAPTILPRRGREGFQGAHDCLLAGGLTPGRQLEAHHRHRRIAGARHHLRPEPARGA